MQKLAEQQNAHAKYQAQDVKHRVAFISVAQVHATAFSTSESGATTEDVLLLAQSVKRCSSEHGKPAALRTQPIAIRIRQGK